jgi:hypothetical protein
MCEPLLYVQDDNHVEKEYEKANEQRVATRRWGCTFCWLGKIVSHDGLGRPCYLPYMWQSNWRLELTLKEENGLTLEFINGVFGRDYRRGTFTGPCFRLRPKMMFFSTKRLLHPIPKRHSYDILGARMSWKPKKSIKFVKIR